MKRERRRRDAIFLLLALLLLGSATGVMLSDDVERPHDDEAEIATTARDEPEPEPTVVPEPRPEPVKHSKPAPEPEAVEPEKPEEAKLSFLEERRLKANETAAVATLRNITSSQAQFQATARADEDGDGTGEFGTFGEMSGGVPIRGTDKPMMPPVLSGAFKVVAAGGVVERSGYRYRIYLPAIGGGWTTEDPGGGVTAGRVDVDRAETTWRVVAWPIEPGKTGRRTLFINQAGDMWSSPEDEMPTIEPNDLSVPDDRSQMLDGEKIAPDGRRWKMFR